MLEPLLMKMRPALHNIQPPLQVFGFRHAEPSFHKTKKKNNVEAGIKNEGSVKVFSIPLPTIIISSPYKRSLLTANEYANKIEYPLDQIVVDSRVSEFEAHHINPFLPMNDGENNLNSPNRFDYVNARLEQFLEELKNNEGVVYIFSHGVILNRLAEYTTGKKLANRGRLVKYATPYQLL